MKRRSARRAVISLLTAACVFAAAAGVFFADAALDGSLAVPAYADSRTVISVVEGSASPQISALPKYGENTETDGLFHVTTTKGSPAFFSVEGTSTWWHQVDGSWQQAFPSDVFSEGKWQLSMQIRLEGTAAKNYRFPNEPAGLTVRVDGKAWTVDLVCNEAGYCFATIVSPVYTVAESGGAVPEDGKSYYIVSAKNGSYALDVAGGSFMPKANVDIYQLNKSEGQIFTLKKCDQDRWQIRNYKGMSLDITGGSESNKANVRTYTWNGSHAQQFRFFANGDGSYTIINFKSGKALDIAGGKMANKSNVQQYTPNGSAAQRWYLVPASPQKTLKEDYCMIGTAVDIGYAVDIAGGSKANGANAQLYKANGSAAQTYRFTYRGNGLYSITNKRSGKVLEVAGGTAGNKKNVRQNAWSGVKAQLWKVDRNSDNTYTIRSALNKNYVLDLAGGKAQNKKNIQIYKSNGSKAQKWHLIYG